MAAAPSAERFFTKVANDVLDATEKLSVRMEEGINAIMTGSLLGDDSSSGSGASAHGGFPASAPSLSNDASADDAAFSEEDLMASPLDGISESVLSDIMKNQAGPQTPWDHFQAFRHAIQWKEPFILSLIAFQIVMFFVCLWVSQRERGLSPRLVVMIMIAVVVRCAERINQYGNANWEEFATQNYFDGRGVFLTIMLCAPLLLNSMMMMLLFLREASSLLIQVKTAELKTKKKQQQQQPQPQAKQRSDGNNTHTRRGKKEQ